MTPSSYIKSYFLYLLKPILWTLFYSKQKDCVPGRDQPQGWFQRRESRAYFYVLSVCVALSQLFGTLVYHFKLVCLPLPFLLICFRCPSRQSDFQGNSAVIHYLIIIVPSMSAWRQASKHLVTPPCQLWDGSEVGGKETNSSGVGRVDQK